MSMSPAFFVLLEDDIQHGVSSLSSYDLAIFLASDDSALDDDVDDSGDESLSNGVAKRKLANKEKLALLIQGNKSDEEQNDDLDMEITFNTELEDLSKHILDRKSTET